MSSTPTRIVELDYDQLKNNLIDFYKNDPTFSDYNFTGSALTALINNLAYTAHYLGYYANMGFSEKFLDSAVTRAAVVSAAKDLGYNPSSITSASANVNVIVNNVTGLPSTLELPKYSKFTATVSSDAGVQSFNFVTTETYTATRIGNNYTFNEILIKEGTPLNYVYTVGNETNFIYEIPNKNVDISTIKVRVQNSSSDFSSTTYTKYSSLSGIDGTSNIFFVEENYKGNPQIQFGDGVIGKKLTLGNLVIIEYISTNGSAANGLKSFVLSSDTFGSGTASTILSDSSINGADGGSDRQSIESIKFTAPKSYVAQNRLVTTNDFYAEIASISSVDSVSVWGGEENEPPVYGAVFISAKPVGSLYLSDTLKNDILINKLRPKKVATITPKFVDPYYTYINLDVTVKYDKNVNNLGSGDIESIVRTSIANYQTENLGKFNVEFIYDSFLSYIKNSNASIVSNYALVKLQKRIKPVFNTELDYSVNLYTKLQKDRIDSTRFYVTINDVNRLVSIKDVNGILQFHDSDSGVVYVDNAGTIDYDIGLIKLNPVSINSLPNGIEDIRITASLEENVFDISTYRNNILLFDDSSINASLNLKNGVSISVIKV